jgi:DNA-directed RNA polymerase subunit M/transcription elongation factor TFIIS
MDLSKPKDLIPLIMVLIVFVGALALLMGNNQGIGLSLPGINMGDNKNTNSNNSTQKTNNQTEQKTDQTNQNDKTSTIAYRVEGAGMPNCPNCGSNNVVSLGTSLDDNGKLLYIYQCNYCGNIFQNHGMI